MKEKLNILFLNSAKSWGGNERWLASAANGLADRGHNVFLAYRTEIFKGRIYDSVRMIKLPFKHEFDLKTRKAIRPLIKEQSIDLLLPTKRKEYFIAGQIGKSMKIPVIFRMGILRSFPGWDLPQRYVYRYLPTAVIVNANIIMESLVHEEIMPAERINVIYNGYEFPDDIEEYALNMPKNKFIFASAGRLTRQKGFDLLLKAASILKLKDRKFHLIIAGEGSERAKCEHFVSNNFLREDVTFTGEIENVSGLFARSDAVVIPSRSEGIPNVLFEAWNAKKPVIASNAAGIPEAVKDGANGLLVSLNPEDIATAMEYIMNNSTAAAKIGDNGYDTLKTKFSLKNMLDQIEELFVKTVNKL